VEYDSQHAPTTQETEPWTKDWPGVSRRAPTSDSIAEAHVADEALGAARQWLARSSKTVSLGLRSGANPRAIGPFRAGSRGRGTMGA
jgi:hypothetical protein